MKRIHHRLLAIIAGATQQDLARQVKYLKVENEILRAKLPKRVPLTEKEKSRLVRFGAKLGKALSELTTIVHPSTLRRWIRQAAKSGKQKLAKKGRPATKEEIRELILKLARENDGWGYTRIMGEIKKLGLRPPSRNTVKRILREHGFDPAPKRGENTWDEFLQQHAKTLWQRDCFSKRILTLKGIREVFVLTFLNVKTRRVVLSPATLHPIEAWVVAQAESFVKQARERGLPVARVQRDRDTKFSRSFDATLQALRVKVQRGAFRAPNTNAFVERFIQSIGQECLDHFVIFGTQHMDHVCQQYLAHYHEERPHQSLNNEPLTVPKKRGRPKTKRGKVEDEIVPLAEIRCQQRLGGLLKSYSRKAA